jgi:hypothetical protein
MNAMHKSSLTLIVIGFMVAGSSWRFEAAAADGSSASTNRPAAKTPERSTPKPLLITKIEAVEYNQKLGSGQAYSLGWGNLPISGGYGQVTSEGYQNYNRTATPPGPVAIMPTDNQLWDAEYPGGELTITYDGGKKVVVLLPKFKDVKGPGFQADGKPFKDGLYVAADGSTYFDAKLTQPARMK